ncbi:MULTISPECIES: YidH family protein [Streptacidiphilus]|uniref:YidH family protein n=1 Tax=Streptacidiphilus cavernicola TaxID=3342716 RepID=A0ABV6UQ35_9ACTN|nr:DUF202 domain-containing protein [Streptacidiphilus jeojiense]
MATGERPPTPESAGTEGPWQEQGEEPDYRATLANERTFLAWTRTSLALLAGSLAVVQLGQATPIALRLALAAYLIALAIATVLVGYHRWRSVQHRMRLRQPLGRSGYQPLIALAMLVLAVLICVSAAVTAP